MIAVGRMNPSATILSPRRPPKRPTTRRTRATTATKIPMARNIWPNFSRVDTWRPLPPDSFRCSGCDEPVGAPGAGPGRTHRLSGASGLRPGGLDLVDRVLGALPGDPGGGLLPEGVGADGGRHLVRTVEPEDGLGVGQRVVRQLVDRALQVLLLETLVGADPAAVRGGDRLVVRPGVGRQERLEGLHLGLVAEGEDELAATEDGLRGRVLAREVEREDVAVLRDLRALRPVRRVERRLAVHVAVTLQDRLAAVLEGGRRDALDVALAEAAVDVLGVLQVPAHGVKRRGRLGAVEGDLVRDPLVVGLRPAEPEHHVLHPVGHRPAGGLARTDARTPRRLAVGDELVRDRLELVERGRHRQAGVLERLGRVPDERLDVRAERGGVELAVDRAVRLPGLLPELVDVGGGLLRRLDGLAGRDELLEQTRLRHDREVGWVARLGAHEHLRLEGLVALVVDLDAGALLELLVRVDLRLDLRRHDAGVDRHRLAVDVTERLVRVVGGAVGPAAGTAATTGRARARTA